MPKASSALLPGIGGKLGVTEAKYAQMLAAQGGVCAICLRPPKKKRLCVDHHHKTGLLRGLLCFRCNYGIGWYNDDLPRLRRLVTYMEKYHAGQ